ncbi:MAG: choice-of-anchor D domain-containing protein, partial [Pseudomonadota bacterium]|nr:choice-of-anchor D domain-containing protein [Pseudomonadota bacterium]
VNALNSRFITTEAGEVYFRLDEVEGVDFRVQKIEGLEDIKYFEDIKHFDLIQSEKVYLFLTHGGDVYSWDQDNPVKPLPGLSDVVTLRVTPYHPRSDTVKLPHYLALKADGSVCGGGDNTLGQLGTEAPAWVPINEPICGIEQLIVNPQPATLTIETTGPGQITSIPAGIACSNDHCQYNYSNPTFVTLTATPETDYRLKKWADDCQVYGRQQQIKVLVEAATHCSAVFELAGEPHLIVEPQSHHFFNVPVGTSLAYTFMLHNSGDSALELGQISVDQSAFKLQEHCSQTQLAPLAECPLTLQFQPQTVADDQTATVTIPSNDPQQPTLTLSLRGSSCSGEPQLQTITMTPQQLDFGTEFIGKHLSLKQKVHAVIEGCGAIVPSTFELTGADAGEFKLEHQNCYQGQYEEKAYFSCLYDLIFSPTTVGDKNAELKISLSEQQLPPLITPLKAKAVDSAQAIVEITPTQHDFGQVVIGRELRSQKFVVHNKGHISLKLTPFTLTGDTDFFLKTDRCRYQSPLHPGESCTVEVGFKPLSAAPQKQAQLILNDNNSVILSGSAEKAADCAQPTIESVASGAWEQASHWQPARIPTTTDIVRIQKPHTLTAPTVITVKALCIEGQLHSPDNGDSLTIQVRDYLENQGSIIGRTGADEPQDCTESCAQPGASLFVEMTYEAWAPDASIAIVNKGQIVAGNGGSGRLLGAAGGNLMISSQLIHNEGTLQAGQGGHLTGTETGSAGPGGTIQIQSYGQFFNQAGAQVQAGDGGNCHPQATAVQTGGNGGDLNLMDTDLVNLQGGQFSAGQAGQACNHNRGGDVLMDPGLLTVAQAHIHGEQVMLYGGQDWLLNLTDINQPNITATQAITLAVGDGGVIDLRGNHGILFNTPGQVNMFTDTLLLDEDQILDDLIQADNIVIGPSQTVRQVALINAGKVSATAGETLTVEFTLVNNSPQPEHFALAATDTEGWLIHSVPATVELEALSSVKLALTLSLPAQSLATDVITVHAASLSAPEIKAVATMNIEATASEELLIELVQLVAIPQGNQIHLKWITQAEKNHAGFRFWRAIQDQQGHYREVTLLAPATPSQTHLLPVTSGDSNVLIPAQGSLVDLRCYHVVDASVEVGKTYFYLLEDISTAGIHTLHWDNIAVATAGIGDNTNFIDF